MHLDDARLFVAIAEGPSLSAAARTLGRSPAAVSAALQRLERRLGVRLVQRSTRALELTDEGRTFVDACRALLDVWADAEAQLQTGRDAVAGPMRVTGPIDLAQQHLAPWLAAFTAAHPGVQVTLQSSDVLQALPADGVDLAVRYGAVEDASLVATRLGATDRIVVAAPALLAARGHPRHPRELADWPVVAWLRQGRPHVRWVLSRGDEVGDVDVRPHLCGDGAVVRAWALAGVGLACKSRMDVADDLDAGRLVEVFPHWTGEALPLMALLPAGRLRSARVEALVDWLRPRVRALAAAGRPNLST
ncbi:MAG: LysR family transcriptional regulator [Alphaproteobacteria bacterium]|nr:LysR family transcriptional regulator [Alphaproteobacteria bacterium]